MAPGDLHDGCHIARMPIHMHSHDRFRSRSDFLFYFRWIDTPCFWIHIYQDWPCTCENHYVGSHNERKVWNDHLITISYAQGHQAQMQRPRPIAAGYSVAGTTIMTETSLQTTPQFSPGCNPNRATQVR